MSKRPNTGGRSKQAAREQFRKKVAKLQKAGLIGKVDFRKKASPETLRAIDKYKGVLSGKESAVRADTVKQARELRKKFGLKGTGKTLVIPREKGERFSVSKRGELTSVRPNPVEPGTKIKKKFGERFAKPPATGDRLYYTLPSRKRGMGRIERKTFATFDEMLFYLNSYDINFEDVEDYIEIEEVIGGGERDKQLRDKIHRERVRRSKKDTERRRKREGWKKRKKKRSSKKR